jgi:hypothetical protein
LGSIFVFLAFFFYFFFSVLSRLVFFKQGNLNVRGMTMLILKHVHMLLTLVNGVVELCRDLVEIGVSQLGYPG